MTAKPFVFAIRPRHLDNFRAGTKRRRIGGEQLEYRTRRPSIATGERHLIYECAPVSKVVAIATIGEVLEGTPAEVWAHTTGDGGITWAEFDRYFSHPCEGCDGSGSDICRPLGVRAIDWGCSDCEGTGAGKPRTKAYAIEMTMAWLASPVALPEGMKPPQSWSRWRGEWPLTGAS
jgi:hypothetical protein